MASRSHSIRRNIAVALILSLALFAMRRAAHGCFVEYRSVDWLAANSPLVIVGEVTAVQGVSGDALFADPLQEPKLSMAEVRVIRVLKGRYDRKSLRLRSGPIRTCAPFEVHATFTIGERFAFICPSYPDDGESQIKFGGSVIRLDDISVLESKIAEAQRYAARYLEALRDRRPEAYRAARDLADELRAAKARWPNRKVATSTDPSVDESYAKAAAPFLKDLVNKLVRTDVEAIRAAPAFDWQSDDSSPWFQHPLWEEARQAIAIQRGAEIAAIERQRLQKVLRDSGVTAQAAESAISSIDKNDLDGTLEFPPSPPSWRVGERLDLASQLILEFDRFDKGMMVHKFAYGFGMKSLDERDAARVKPYVARLCQSDIERLRWLGERAIAETAGTRFVDLVYDDLVVHGHSNAWRALRPREPGSSAERFIALLAESQKLERSNSQAEFWIALRKGECFESVFLDGAVKVLETSQAPRTPLGDAVRAYLDEAIRQRAEKTSTPKSPQEYTRLIEQTSEKPPPPQGKVDDQDDAAER